MIMMQNEMLVNHECKWRDTNEWIQMNDCWWIDAYKLGGAKFRVWQRDYQNSRLKKEKYVETTK